MEQTSPNLVDGSPAHDIANNIDKFLCPVLIFVVSVFFGCCPILLPKLPCLARQRNKAKYSDIGGQKDEQHSGLDNLKALSSGALLAILVIKILPELRESFQGEDDKRKSGIYVLFGLLVIILVEVIIERVEFWRGNSGNKATNYERKIGKNPRLLSDSDSDDELVVMSLEGLVKANQEIPDYFAETQSCFSYLVSSLSFMLAICLHSVLEGVALASFGADLWTLTAALCFHKGIVALALGTSLHQRRRRGNAESFGCLNVILIAVFASMTPLGFIIGKVNLDAIPISTRQLLSSSAVGSLFYVSLFELFPAEAANSVSGRIAFSGGLVSASVLQWILL